MVKSLLQDAGIESFLQHATDSSYAFQPIQATAVKVIISGADREIAKEIVEEYCRNMQQN